MRNQVSVLYDHQKNSLVCLQTCCLKNRQKIETDNSINFGLLGATFFVFPLSVRICAVLYNAILWEIVHIPSPKYGLRGVEVE